MGRVRSCLTGLLVIAGLSWVPCACQEDGSPDPEPAPQGTSAAGSPALAELRTRARGANVLLITIDTLRADRVGCYGHAPARTPTLDRLAAEGVQVERALATVPLTLPSHTSLLTGLNPMRHGVRDNTLFVAVPELVTLGECFQEQGYRTAAFVSSFVLSRRYGLDQGFDHYDGRAEDFGGGLDHATRRGALTVNRCLEWMEQAPPEPWFVWLHLYDPHRPWEAPEPFATEIADPYDAEVAYADKQVGRFLRRFDEAGRLDRTLVVVTSDHGEGMEDHGESSHGLFVYDSTMHVPLILRFPPLGAGKRLSGQVSLVDLAPTLADLFALQGLAEADTDGRSFLAALLDERPEVWHDAYLETLMPTISYGLASLRAISVQEFKYVQAPRPELYDWRDDPGELRNRFLEQAADVDRLQSKLEQFVQQEGGDLRTAIDLSPEELQRLESLGYVQGGGAASMQGGDPKDFLDLVQAEAAALGLIESGQVEDALPILQSVLQACPDSSLGWAYLGQALIMLSRWEDAIEPCRKAVELRPDRPRSLLNLALAYSGSRQPERTLETYAELRRRHPAVLEGYLNPARILADRGDFEPALALLREARAHAIQDVQRAEIDRRIAAVEQQQEEGSGPSRFP